MTNEIRGERAVRLGTGTFDIALTFGAMAALESAFGLDNFEEVKKKLFRIERQGEGDAAKERYFVNAANVLRFWEVVFKANDLEPAQVAKIAGDPYDAGTQAIALINSAYSTGLEGDRKDGSTSSPLAAADAGASG